MMAAQQPAENPLLNVTIAAIDRFHAAPTLQDLMRTAAGRAVAESRHKYMQEFVERFHAEWEAAQ